jgi:lantibiotic modifying enzyme
MSGLTYIGYAHGAAGIGDSLLDLYDCTNDERFLAIAQKAARWLKNLATPGLADESGLGWPKVEGGLIAGSFWCHGATGVGRFFLHAAKLGADSHAADIATRAARMAARGARWAGPSQCHGLAGNIEFLLDMAQATGDESYFVEASSLGSILERFIMTEQKKDSIWSSWTPEPIDPG